MLVIQILDDRSNCVSAQSPSRLAIQWQGPAEQNHDGHACMSVHLDRNPELKASFLDVIAQAYIEYGSPAQAIAVLEEAVALRTSVFGASHPLTASSQRNLASALRHASRLDEATTQIERARDTLEKFFGDENVEYADATLERAAIGLAANRLDQARSDAMSSFETLDSKDDIRKLHALDLAARVIDVCAAGDKSKLLEAAKLYGRILKDARVGDEHPWRNAYLHNEATILHGLGEYEAARERFDAVVERWLKESGDARPYVVDAFINRGRTLRELGDREAARRDVEAALALDRSIRGSNHPYVAYDLVCLARLLMEQDGNENHAAAERALNEAIDIYRRSGFTNHTYLEVALRRRFQLLKNPADEREAEQIRKAVVASCTGPQSNCG